MRSARFSALTATESRTPLREVTVVFMTDLDLSDEEWTLSLESLGDDISIIEVNQEEA